MDFVKKHYEKIILSAVLLGLVVALVALPVVISKDQEHIKYMSRSYTTPRVTPLSSLDLTRQTAVLQRVQSPPSWDFSPPNKLFNPLEWKKTSDGTMFPIKNGNETGASAATVTKITPLFLVLTFDMVETNGAAPRYVIGVERQAAANPYLRRKQQRYASAGEKTDLFVLADVTGDPLNPSGVDLILNDTGDKVSVTKDKPYQRADAYAADLKYDLEKKSFAGLRVGSHLSFDSEDYIVVAVSADEVILSAQSNQKKTTLRYAP